VQNVSRAARHHGGMSIPVSVDDAFTVGVSFDLLGGYLLGRGLLASPNEIARRTTQITTWGQGFNAAEAVTHIRSRADALAGLLALGLGFLLQWGGYVALIGGATVETGPGRAVAAAALAIVAAGLAFRLFRRIRWRLIKRFSVQVARANPATGTMDDFPDQETLIAIGQGLGMNVVQVTPEGVVVVSEWAKREFGVEHLSRRLPLTMPAAPRR
jgi:hypothetical protein